MGIHYCIGKVLTFHEASEGSGPDDGQDAVHWFELGSDVDCLHSALEVWRKNYKPNVGYFVCSVDVQLFTISERVFRVGCCFL